MSIVAAIALPQWNQLLPGYRLDNSVRQVQSELNNLRMRAAAENATFLLQYSDGASTYTIVRASKPLVSKPLPDGIVIHKSGSISFSPRGTAGGNRVRLHHATGLCKQVVASQTGRVRVCQPTNCSVDC